MKKFVMEFYGSVGVPEGMKMEDVMGDWGKWFAELGSAIVDSGNPFNDGGQQITRDGVTVLGAEDMPATGYTIINAESMEKAVELAKNCPSFRHNKDAAVRVYEAMAM